MNSGVCVARNRCINEAKGKYIWFIDPDDLVVPNIANIILSIAHRSDADFVATNYTRVAEDFTLTEVNYCNESKSEAKSYYIVEKGVNYLPRDSQGKQMCAVWAGIFKRSFLFEHSLRFREGMIAQEDTLFYYELERLNPIIVKCNASAYLYRIRSGSIMHSKSEARSKAYYRSMLKMLEVYVEYFNKEGDDEKVRGKIKHTQENIALQLSLIQDTRYVRAEMGKLRKRGLYPFATRWSALRGTSNFIYKINSLFLPHSIYFWFLHYLNRSLAKVSLYHKKLNI